MNDNTEKGKAKVCSIENCVKRAHARGFCSMHYKRNKLYGDPYYVQKEFGKYEYCSVKDCDKKHDSKGYCKNHYMMWRKYGDPLYRKPRGKCSISSCGKKIHNYGYCKNHYYTSDKVKELKRSRRASRRNAPINDLTSKDWEVCLSEFEHSCAYCNEKANDLTQDHINPLSRNGSHTITNIIPACLSCNSSKNARPLELWFPKQPFYEREQEAKILEWMGHKVKGEKIQMKLF